MKKINLKKGFTLIELLMVVAIIGLLSAVVLASLNSARGKGADAAIKADLKTISNQAEIYYSAASTYGGGHSDVACLSTASGNVFADPIIQSAIVHANNTSGGSLSGSSYTNTGCAATITGTSYAIAVTLKGGGSWCVDSSGASRKVSVPATDVNSVVNTGGVYVCGV